MPASRSACRSTLRRATIASTFSPTMQPGLGELQQGVLDLALAVPNVRAEAGAAAAHVRVGWYRSVYNIFHAFAIGSFVDEIAAARSLPDGVPLASQLELLLRRVEELHEGAFSPFSQQPVVRAMLLPLGGLGGTALLNYLLVPGLG